MTDSGLSEKFAPLDAIYLTKIANADLTVERATELRVAIPANGSDIQIQINDLPT